MIDNNKKDKNMRNCHRCHQEMVEGFDIKIEGAGYGIKLSKGQGMFAKRIGKPQVAICPGCGEISLFLIDTMEVFNHKKKEK